MVRPRVAPPFPNRYHLRLRLRYPLALPPLAAGANWCARSQVRHKIVILPMISGPQKPSPMNMKPLSHYTSIQGLIGIVRSQCLHATEFQALNDQMEFSYAMAAIYDEAIATVLPKIPSELRDSNKTDAQLRALRPDYVAMLRKQMSAKDGFGSLYVTSFARGRNEDENERGILTLWDR
jgi:hypothetical protein